MGLKGVYITRTCFPDDNYIKKPPISLNCKTGTKIYNYYPYRSVVCSSLNSKFTTVTIYSSYPLFCLVVPDSNATFLSFIALQIVCRKTQITSRELTAVHQADKIKRNVLCCGQQIKNTAANAQITSFAAIQISKKQQNRQTQYMSLCMGKPTICIGKNKGADQLRSSNCEADQRLCFRYTDSTVPLLSKS